MAIYYVPDNPFGMQPPPYGYPPYGTGPSTPLDTKSLKKMSKFLKKLETENKKKSEESDKKKKETKKPIFTKVEVYTLLALSWPVVFLVWISAYQHMLSSLKGLLPN